MKKNLYSIKILLSNFTTTDPWTKTLGCWGIATLFS